MTFASDKNVSCSRKLKNALKAFHWQSHPFLPLVWATYTVSCEKNGKCGKGLKIKKKNNREKHGIKIWIVSLDFELQLMVFLSLMNAIFIRFYVEKKNQFLSIDVELKQENCIISLDVRIRYVPRFEMNFPGWFFFLFTHTFLFSQRYRFYSRLVMKYRKLGFH